MGRIKPVTLLLLFLFVPWRCVHAQAPMTFRVLCGITDATLARWDGSLKVKNAGAYTLEGWRFERDDGIEGNRFHFSTRGARRFGEAEGTSMTANGLILNASAVTDRSEFTFKTAQGDFSFGPSDLSYGKGIHVLNGRVYIDRVPVAARLMNTLEEEDYPSWPRV